MKIYWRWLLILPAVAGAYAVVQILIIVGTFIWGRDTPAVWTQFVSSIICPAASVWVAAKIAPSHQTIAAICVTVLLATLGVGLIVWQVDKGLISGVQIVWDSICCAVGIAGSVFICHES